MDASRAAQQPLSFCLLSSVMRALRVLLTALGFATLFTVLMISSAIITAGLHRAMSSTEPHPQLIAPTVEVPLVTPNCKSV